MWSQKFLAHLSTRGYRIVITTDTIIPPASQTSVTAAETRMRKANTTAYDDLINSMEEETCFGLVSEAITNDLPEGDA